MQADAQMFETLYNAVLAGLLASIACGLGALPLAFKFVDPKKHTGLGYAFAGGLMFSASVYNLILPGLEMAKESSKLEQIWPIIVGILLGAGLLSLTDKYFSHNKIEHKENNFLGNKTFILIFIAMTIHSIPEGVAVGVGYTSETFYENMQGQGSYLAIAIGIHNIPEGLAVAIPLRASGVSIWKCFIAAFLTSLPQPLACIPAVLASWFFQPIIVILMGFAAGAMIFLVLQEMIPEALHTEKPSRIAWMFTFGFCLMLLIQVVI